MELELETVLTLLECPVCLLPPRDSPIYQCSTGHLVCNECKPSLTRCPICDIRYRSTLTRDFFAEKLLEHLERRCRYQHFGCEFSTRVSSELRGHEAVCELKPPHPVRRRSRKRSGEQVAQGDGDNNIEEDEEDEEEEEEEDDEEEEMEIEDIFISNFAFILVLLRAYILEYVEVDGRGATSETSFSFEFLLLLLISAWLYHAWQENGFLMLDETSPFIACWFIVVVLLLMVARSYYNPAQSEGQLEDFKELMLHVKPLVTLLTGLFSCGVHGYVHNMLREENFFILTCVLGLSCGLSGMETLWQMQSQMDQIFYYLFWLQSFFIVLPFGLVGRNFLEF